MRIEKLSGDKIKVTLTTSDLLKFDVNIEDLYPESKELHSFLFSIMEAIREETGFNPYSGQVVVEATPLREGISIVVSKLRSGIEKKSELKSGVTVRAKRKKRDVSKIFYFDDFDDLCAALSILYDEELMSGALYRLGDTYCFALENPSGMQRCVSVMTEYSAGRSVYPLQMTYIREHGKMIAFGESLCNMVKNIRELA